MSTSTSRRRFIEIMPFAGVALLAACSPKVEPTSPVAAMPPETPQPVPAPVTAAPPSATSALPMVNTKDALAVSLGYVDDAANADRVKYANYVPASQCSNCALYMGKAGEASGGCPLFQGQLVTAMGWCSSWVKKA
jgi:hypothetical protein